MDFDEKRKLENQLMAMGLSRLSDPALIAQMAMIVNDCTRYGMDRHEFLAGLLACADADKRSTMFEALRPHLDFELWPLDEYVSFAKNKSAASESWGAPVTVGDRQYEVVPSRHATGVVVSFRCSQCNRTRDYYGETPVSAVILGRQDGWVRQRGTEKEICPRCECSDRGEKRKCPHCQRKHYAPPCTAVSARPADESEQAELEARFSKVTIH